MTWLAGRCEALRSRQGRLTCLLGRGAGCSRVLLGVKGVGDVLTGRVLLGVKGVDDVLAGRGAGC